MTYSVEGGQDQNKIIKISTSLEFINIHKISILISTISLVAIQVTLLLLSITVL